MPNILTTTAVSVNLSVADNRAFIASGATLVGSVFSSIADSVVTANGDIYYSGNNYAVDFRGNNASLFVADGSSITSGAAAVFFSGDNLTITNHGDMSQTSNIGYSTFDLRGSNVKIYNTGTISAAGPISTIFIGSSTPPAFAMNYITNSGTITGLGVFDVRNSVSINNTGIIDSTGPRDIFMEGVTFALNNSGTYNATSIDLRMTGSNSIINTGTIDANISMGSVAGVLSFDSTDGIFHGVVRASQGANNADTIIGGAASETFFGGSGGDILRGNGGADSLYGEDGADTLYFDSEDLRFGVVSGGGGYDTGYYTDEVTPLVINMGAQGLEGYFGSAANETVIAGNLGGFSAFVQLAAGNDLFDGSVGTDIVNGGDGVDVLYGRAGIDDLAGGIGGDWLQGGTGSDTFRYNSLLDSTVNGQDFIADFSTAEGDKINLTNALAGLAPATFNAGYGTGTSVYVFAGGGGTSLVQVYTGTTLQMQIVASQASLAAGDFVL